MVVVVDTSDVVAVVVVDTGDVAACVVSVIPVVFGLVKMGYGGGEVLTLGPCEVESGREGADNREKMSSSGGGKEGSDMAMVCMVSAFGRTWAARPKIDISIFNLYHK